MKHFFIALILVNLICFAHAQTPPTAQNHLETGKKLLDQNKIALAIESFSQAIATDKNFAEAYQKRGLAYYAFANYPKAEENYNQAILLQPKYAEAYYCRGVLGFMQGKTITAKRDFEQTLVYAPTSALTHVQAMMSLAAIALRDVDNKTAFDWYSKAIETNPNYAFAYYERAAMYYNVFEEDKKAFVDVSKAILLKNDYADAYHLRGLLEYQLKKYHKALPDFDKAITLNPTDANYYLERAQINFKLKKKEKACADFKKAVSLGAEDKILEKRYCK